MIAGMATNQSGQADGQDEAHLARYVVDVVEGVDLTALERVYAGRGSDAHHPATLLSLLIYGYSVLTNASSECSITVLQGGLSSYRFKNKIKITHRPPISAR